MVSNLKPECEQILDDVEAKASELMREFGGCGKNGVNHYADIIQQELSGLFTYAHRFPCSLSADAVADFERIVRQRIGIEIR